MGYALATRLLEAGCDVAVYNRTRPRPSRSLSSAPRLSTHPSELAGREIVFTMVAGPEDFKAVVLGENGLLSRSDAAPSVIVDSSTSRRRRQPRCGPDRSARCGAARGAPVRAIPRSSTQASSRSSSGPERRVGSRRPYLELFGAGRPMSARATSHGWSRSATT